MKKIFLLFAMLSAISSYGQPAPARKNLNIDSLRMRMEARRKTATGKPFPEFSVLLNNRSCSNKDLQGKIVFINFWFAACPPCIAELEALNNLYDRFKTDSSFEFISFTFEDEKTIASFRQQYHMEYKVLSMPHDSCNQLNFGSGFPTNMILDKNGTISYFKSGGEMERKAIARYFSNEVYPLLLQALH